jgi:PAS domain S-box-containing protein
MNPQPTVHWPAAAPRDAAAFPFEHHHERPSADAALQQMVDAAGVGLASLRADGCLQHINPRAAAMLGRPAAALLGLHLIDLVHPDDAAGLSASMDQMLAGQGEGLRRDTRWLLPGGQVAHLCMHLQPIAACGPEGVRQVTGLAMVLDDVSERVQMAAVLDSARNATQASRAKTEFLSRMSHELRTPLNAMLGFAQLLRVDPRHPLHETQFQKVSHIERAGAHLLAMMNDVLDLSRIEAGSLPMSLQAVHVHKVVDEAIAMVSHQASDAKLQLTAHVADAVVVHPGLAPPPVHVLADPVRLRQVLVNLLSNAIKYNRPGGRVMLEAMAMDGQVLFNVSDTGPGMGPQQLSHLFEPFNRLGAERTAVEGTGIGLVIVKRLLDLMHGRVEVSSAPGTGSSFKVWLPLASAGQGTSSPQAHQAGGEPPTDGHPSSLAQADSGPTAARGPQRTVLYAEDNVINVELVRQVMRMRPHWQLEVALCGQQAIDMARQSPPDLLLLDMHLGDMSGLDVSDALADHAPTTAVPRVALSADAMPDQINEARARGFVDYLTKPLDVGRFLALLDQLAYPPAPGR